MLGGLLWFLFAVGFGWFLLQYVHQGAGLQFAGVGISSGGILIGLVHVVGLSMAVLLCLVIGLGLCVHGLVPRSERKETRENWLDGYE
ncbi:MAG: hypothetical protein JWQ71_2397 [Pedosphaera sp.]|nr:hypothetical protein [Pedosphaera sp.]